MTQLSESRRHRSGLLDCIRAAAILMVVAFHVAAHYPAEALDPLGWFFRRFGSKGVDIFFPLSGYLITRFLLADRKSGFIKTFFLRRFFRIVPLYFVAVTLFVCAMLTGYDAHLMDRVWINYTFLTGWFIFFDGSQTVPFTLTWSLSVEEFAYIVLGLLAWASRRRLPVVLILLSIGPALLRYYLIDAGDGDGIYYLPLTRIDSIALGGVTAWALMHRRPATVMGWLALALAATAVLSVQGDVEWQTLIYTMISLGTCLTMVLFDTWLKGVDNAAIRAGANIGFYSYFTYLFHFFNIYMVFAAWELVSSGLPPFWPAVVLSFGLTHLQAMLSYRWFEGPLMGFGRTLEQPRQTAKAGTAPSGLAK